jgi:hypothetical protein
MRHDAILNHNCFKKELWRSTDALHGLQMTYYDSMIAEIDVTRSRFEVIKKHELDFESLRIWFHRFDHGEKLCGSYP